MEERLFWIGAAMFLYAAGSKRWAKAGWLDARGAAAAWHGLFCAIVGFSAAMVAAMSLESRARFSSVAVGVLSAREVYYGLLGGSGFGAWGAWRAWRRGADAEGRRRYRTEDLEWAETVFSAVFLASVLMYFVVQAFKIPSGSMRTTLLEGDHLFVNKFVYGVRAPFTKKRWLRLKPVQRGDIVVFRFPSDDPQEVHCGGSQYGKDFIKRVIGLPGDEVRVSDGELSVNGTRMVDEPYAQYLDGFRQPKPRVAPAQREYQELWQSHKLDGSIGDVMRDHFGPVTVPPGSYLVMGDNRDRSCDSRFWGPVQEHYLKGKAWVLYWPPSRMGGVR